MAYVNVLDWKAEQVADWLRGLEDTVYPYAHFFLNNDVTGQVRIGSRGVLFSYRCASVLKFTLLSYLRHPPPPTLPLALNWLHGASTPVHLSFFSFFISFM
jgi:hypothetical protein